ncbi:MAG: TM2 domain-containing protein [Clostridiaceae bacterium]|nr:TM2 domain-containing protein [Clostridiaceae bacterium]
MQYKELVPQDKIAILKNALNNANDSSYDNVSMAKTYNPTTVLLCSIFLGGIGVDRFIIGDVGLGIAKLLFGWITLGIWPLIDIFFSYKKAKEKNLQTILSSL